MFTGSSSEGLGAIGQKGSSLGNWADEGWHQYVTGGLKGMCCNEGKRKDEVVQDCESVSAQGRREQMKEW